LQKKILILLSTLTFLIAASSLLLAPAIAQEDVTFRMSLTEGAPKYFIQAIGGGPQQYVAMLVFDPLVQVDVKTFEIMPNLASSWDISADGLTYTFHLVTNAKWHDGTPFSSADVKYTFNYIIQNKLSGFSFLRGVASIDTPDANTVVIQLTKADASFLIKVNGRYSGLTDILPMHILDGTDWTKNNAFLQHPIGTGPYKFDSYDGTNLVLVRNDDYFAGKPGFAKVVATVVPDNTLAMKAFENNELDWVYSSQIPSVSEYLRLKGLSGNTGDTFFQFVEAIEFNTNVAPFNDVKVRQAFAYAINRDELNQKIFLGQGKAQVNPAFPDWLTWAVSPNVKLPAYDPAMANQILDQAGYTKGNDGFRFTVKISYAAPYSPPPTFVDVLKSDLAQVGINVVHEPNEWDVWYQKVYTNRDFQVSLHHVIVVGDPEIGVADEIVPGRLYNFGYNNTDVVNLYSEAAARPNRADRASIYAQVQQKLADDMPYIMLVDAPTMFLWKTGFTGILKGDNYRLRFATPVAAQTTATMATGETTSAPTEVAPMPIDYTPYIVGAVVVIVILAAAYAFMKRKKPKT
jgi:peptide/nickel transport system substrate-binding protein